MFLNDLQILARNTSMSTFEGLRDDLFLVTTFIGDNIAGYKSTTIIMISILQNIV